MHIPSCTNGLVKRGYYRTYQDAEASDVGEGGRDGGPGEGELP